ncbi:flagellar WD-repeat protein PF20 (macronuclear) [Tetrahymena thermophila SB210]|uniref:Flagellar WD-repeat protein PF20 n=1 Tax=Tetrahymena thermophila (strain SB210) TaxID=312017 RepID=I7MKK1_TETTS|nr:flagellar WD-repeat protein PF20 [Tetrahymena thermophila SB210]EAR99424.2 flagellar WD-repeat protein PF20 [Tetrahymena thermophila SB210]|eukprot:XP_001019669.2 flagellar WD-repeat protein PF20 [Tetrahymena thermophila SB210]
MSSIQEIKEEKEGEFYVMEAVELTSESEPEDLDGLSEIDDMKVDDEDINDLDKLVATTRKEVIVPPKEDKKPVSKTVKRLEVVDDFIRNFLIKHKMTRSLEVFQQEWYELSQKGRLTSDTIGQVPDVYIRNEKLEDEMDYLRNELDKAKIIAEKAKATYDKLRKERDFHKMHHHRVQQEKKKLNNDIEKLKALHQQYETKYEELSQKYAHAMKEKMLLKLERDRLVAKNEALQKSLQNIEDKMGKEGTGLGPEGLPKLNDSYKQQKDQEEKSPKAGTQKKNKLNYTPIPSDNRPNPYAGLNFDTQPYRNAVLQKTFKGHMMAISSIAMHPKRSICATASDDFTWKIWTLPQGELILSGEGHKDWVSGISFHPKGSHLVTSSGDCTIKVWDFINSTCTHTFKDHIQPVWDVAYHDTGDFIVSGSMDHTAKLFDLGCGKRVHTFKGHKDSVNCVKFQPYSNILATASADQTLSLWDMRSGLCAQTFYGHRITVNYLDFSLKGDTLASCDADGVVKVWDVRMVKERNQYMGSVKSVNSVAIDKSGVMIACADDEGNIKLFNDSTGKLEHTLKGHEDKVEDVAFDFNSKMIVSCGADSTFRVWQ